MGKTPFLENIEAKSLKRNAAAQHTQMNGEYDHWLCCGNCTNLWDGRSRSSGDDERITPSPEEGQVETLQFVSVVFRRWLPRQIFNKRAISSVPGSQEGEVGGVAMPCHPQPPLSSPAGSLIRFENAMPSNMYPAIQWSQVIVALHTQIPLQAAMPSNLGPCPPPRFPTAGTSVVPLIPLAWSLRAWKAFPSPSIWLIRTIRLGYAIQFAPRPPKFRGVQFTSELKERCLETPLS
ncbi:hypothetical protein PO909_025886 [Leuciscus waleckii]